MEAGHVTICYHYQYGCPLMELNQGRIRSVPPIWISFDGTQVGSFREQQPQLVRALSMKSMGHRTSARSSEILKLLPGSTVHLAMLFKNPPHEPNCEQDAMATLLQTKDMAIPSGILTMEDPHSIPLFHFCLCFYAKTLKSFCQADHGGTAICLRELMKVRVSASTSD